MDSAGVDSAIKDAAGAGCDEVDGAEVDNTGVGNGTKNDDEVETAKGIKVNIITSKFKKSILISS